MNSATPIILARCSATGAKDRTIRVSLTVSRFLIDYPFANRLFPNSLDVVEHVKQWGPPVILSDGDVVFQPRKVERSGLFEAVEWPRPDLCAQGTGARRRHRIVIRPIIM